MKTTLAASAATLFAAVALAAGPAASATPADDEFLKVIADGGINLPADKALAGAHGICKDWEDGVPLSKEVSDFQKVTSWTDYQIGVFIGAATLEYCPQYKSNLPTS
jgi:poly(3-hydroxybutyrate) depolymerase